MTDTPQRHPHHSTVYVAKCYWPGVTEAELDRVADSAVREADMVSRTGSPVAYLGAILFPDDELVLCLFDSPSRAAVKETNERAGIPCERIMESILLTDLSPDPNRTGS